MSLALRPLDDPARDAANLLGRLGLVVLTIAIPVVGVFSRAALFSLLPVGCVLVLIGAYLATPAKGARHFLAGMTTSAGLTLVFILFWAALSLLWTAYPAIAFQRFFKIAASTALAALVTAYLPNHTKTYQLYLLPAGLAVTAVLTIAAIAIGLGGFAEGTPFDTSLQDRCVLTLVLLAWPALGGLCLRERWIGAGAMAVAVAIVAVVAWSQVALAAMAVAALVFSAAMSAPRQVARVTACFFVPFVLLAPVLPVVLVLAMTQAGGNSADLTASLQAWSEIVRSDWLRFVTGHGLDMALQGVATGFLPAYAPQSILFELWYDLGLLGAVAFAAMTAIALRYAGRTPVQIAPALLAGLAAGLVIAILGLARAQLWFVTICALDVVAFALLVKASTRNTRPMADEVDPLPEA